MKKLIIIFSLFISIFSMASTDDELQKASKLITKGELKKAQIILENLSKENLSKEVSLRVFNNLALIYNSWNNVEESSKYYTKILELHSDDNWYNINSNQKLLSYALDEKDYDSALRYMENINSLTKYTEIPFVANLIYLYENSNKSDKLFNLNNLYIEKMSKNNKLMLYTLLFNMFYEDRNIDRSLKYLDKIKLIQTSEAKLTYFVYANKFKNIYDGLLDIEDINIDSIKNDIDINILDELKNIYIINNQLEKAYKIINIMLEKSYTPRIVMQALKLATIFEDTQNIRKYTNFLEMNSDRGYNLGIAYFNEGMDEYAEKYLLKALEENDKRSYYILLRIYFHTFNDKGLANLLNKAIKKNIINEEEKNKVNYEYLQYKEYKNRKERVGVK